MQELALPWLEISVIVPLLGAMTVRWLRDKDLQYRVSVILCSATLLFAVAEWIDFGLLHAFEAHDHWDMLKHLFHVDVFVIDELNAPLLPLAALLYLLTVLSTVRTKVHRFPFASTLFSEAVLLATLSCRQPLAIIVLSIIAIIPPWLEIQSRGHSTRVFSLHMGLFIGLLLSGWLLLPEATAANPEANNGVRFLTAGALLTAAAMLRTGVIPVHCWMTDLFEKASLGTALLYASQMTGAYIVMRIVLPIAPIWALQGIALISLLTSVYAAGMTLVQTDIRRFFCYLFLSHSSLVLIGLELLTPIGLTGALCVWVSAGLTMGGFGLILRSVEARVGHFTLTEYRGLFEHMPTLAALFLVMGLASIGFPGTLGFIGTELLIEGVVGVYPLIGTVVVLATALNSIAVMYAYFRIFTGTTYEVAISLHIKPVERLALLTLTVLIIGGGLYAQPGVASRYHAAMELIRLRNPATTTIPAQEDHNL